MEPVLAENIELQKEIESEIHQFKISFCNKFGFMPIIMPPRADKLNKNRPEINMDTIYTIVDKMLFDWHPDSPPEGLRAKTRKHNIVIFRQMFIKISFDYGYGCTAVSNFLGNFDHATMLHGNRAFTNLLDSDRKVKEMHQEFLQQLKFYTIRKEDVQPNSMVDRAKIFAIACHMETLHKYEDKPYEFHLETIVTAAKRFIELIPDYLHQTILGACWCFKTIQCCRKSYQDIVTSLDKNIAEYALILVEPIGRTEEEIDYKSYYKKLKELPYAGFIKCCERIADVEYYKSTGNTEMLKKFKKENPKFQTALYDKEYWQAFDYLKALFNN